MLLLVNLFLKLLGVGTIVLDAVLLLSRTLLAGEAPTFGDLKFVSSTLFVTAAHEESLRW